MRTLTCTALAALIAMLAACSSSRSPRCKEICQREVRCIRELQRVDIHIDETECISACTGLDRDSQGRRLVDEHEQCVQRASTCEDVLACH